MKRKLICAGILCLGTLLSICLAMLTLQNLGAILSLFVDTSGDQPDFVAIFAQTRDAALSPPWLLPLLLWTGFAALLYFLPPKVAERESNRIARRRCIFVSSGELWLARLVSCFAKSHQNLSKMHSPAGASSFDQADFSKPKSFSRRIYRRYFQEERCRDGENLLRQNQLGSIPVRLPKAALKTVLYAVGGTLLFPISYVLTLLLCQVNGVRFLDLLRALVPMLGSL